MANPNNLRPKEHLERAFDSPVLTRLGHIAVPTFIVAGEHDIADVHAHCGAVEAGIPGARRLVLRSSGHLPISRCRASSTPRSSASSRPSSADQRRLKAQANPQA